MKKLFLVLIFATSLSFGQTTDEYYNKANDKAKLQDYRGAIEDYTKVIELNPNYSKAYNNRGNSKAKLQDDSGAIADYTKAIELNPNYSNAYYNRGNSKKILKDTNGACLDWSKAVELGEGDAYDLIKENCK